MHALINRKLFLLILLPLMLSLFISSVNASASTIYPIADSRVKDTTPYMNYGSSDILCARWNAVKERSFLRFSLSSIPSGSTITSAKLYLRTEHTDGGGNVAIYFVSDDGWGESSITWNNQPSYGPILTSTSVTAEYTWHSWDVTEQIQTEFNGDKIVSLMAGSSDASLIEFDSRDYNGHDPYLKVTYEAGEEEEEGEGQLEISLENFPQAMANKVGIPLFASQLLASVLTLVLFLFPSMMLIKGRASQTYVILFVGFSVMGVCIALGWLPYWFLLIVALVVACLWKTHRI